MIVFYYITLHLFYQILSMNSKSSSMVIFWDLASGEVHAKSVGNLKYLTAYGDVCAVVVAEKGDSRIGGNSVWEKNIDFILKFDFNAYFDYLFVFHDEAQIC